MAWMMSGGILTLTNGSRPVAGRPRLFGPTEIVFSVPPKLPVFIVSLLGCSGRCPSSTSPRDNAQNRSEEHTSELQSPDHLVCRLLLEKKKQNPYLNSQHHLKSSHIIGRLKQLKAINLTVGTSVC